MKRSLCVMACATIAGAFAIYAEAQTPPSGSPTPSQPMAVPPTMPGAGADPKRKAGPDPHPQAETQPVAGAAGSDPKAGADAGYKAAQKACDSKSGPEKDNCLKDAKTDYDRGLGRKEPASGVGSSAPAGAGQK